MTDRSDVAAVVLAAGLGTRFRSDLAKVLHRACGRSILGHILTALAPLGLGQVIVVVGHQADDVEEEARRHGVPGLAFALQAEQLGTGHAAQMAMPALAAGIRRVVVLPGDVPLLRPDTIGELLDADAEAASILLSARVADPTGYGRIIRQDGHVIRIVEHKDADDAEREVDEVNAGIYLFARELLASALTELDTDNAQGELYLTDVVEILVRDGHRVEGVIAPEGEVAGINDRGQLADAATVLRRRVLDDLMRSGVTIMDPATTYVDVGVAVGRDTVLLPGTILQGDTTVGAEATVGPHSHLVDTIVEDGALVRYAVCQGASIGPEANVGPFTYLRPGTRLERGAKAGGFVEMKQAHVGEGSKVPHLSYIGDATIGRDANVGAGTITCNYDGFDKHETTIGDGAFIGSDTMLVAPVNIGAGAVTGAASAITGDVPPDALALERNDQAIIEDWARRRRERHGKA